MFTNQPFLASGVILFGVGQVIVIVLRRFIRRRATFLPGISLSLHGGFHLQEALGVVLQLLQGKLKFLLQRTRSFPNSAFYFQLFGVSPLVVSPEQLETTIRRLDERCRVVEF